MIDWSHVYYKRYIPPYIPPIDPSNETDTQNFDEAFLGMEPVIGDEGDEFEREEEGDADVDADADGYDGGRSSRSASASEREDDDNDADGDVKMEDEGRRTPTKDAPESSSSQQANGSGVGGRRPKKQAEGANGEEEEKDVFDGYSFKGRHSVLLDDEDLDLDGQGSGSGSESGSGSGSEESGSEEEEEEESREGVDGHEDEEEGEDGRTTPVLKAPPKPQPQQQEASKPALAPAPTPAEAIIEEHRAALAAQAQAQAQAAAQATAAAPRKSKELPQQPEVTAADSAPPAIPEKLARPAPAPSRPPRKEKSGVTALDRYASFTEDDYDEDHLGEDDDWDLVEGNVMEDKNGARGTSLFARGVVDRYKLTVFKKPSATPTTSESSPARATLSRMGSFKSRRGTTGADSESEMNSPPGTPNLTKKKSAKNLNPLKFRTQRQFLKPKSSSSAPSGSESNPPSSFSYAQAKKAGLNGAGFDGGSNPGTLSAASTMSSFASKGSMSMSGTLSGSGSHSMPSSTTSPMSPSLKSKESAMSMGQTSNSDQSANGDNVHGGANNVQAGAAAAGEEKAKNKKLKKYKDNAGKVLSLLTGSPKGGANAN
jgi:serum/glucocorticoid-regulated kinase 2